MARARSQGGLVVVAGGLLVGLLAFPLLLRAFVLEAFRIPSRSMEPALLAGDHIFVDKVPWHRTALSRGEVIVFHFPENVEQDFVKRVIALPGDTLEVKHGHPWLNGWEVPHCVVGKGSLPRGEEGLPPVGELDVEFLDGRAYLVFFGGAFDVVDQGPFAAAPGEVWVLGDNRESSHDSRFWWNQKGGGVPFDLVVGRALFRWLSVSGEGVDRSRIGTSVATPLLPKSMASLEPDLQRCLASAPPLDKTTPPAPR